jgi:hypothetical protein
MADKPDKRLEGMRANPKKDWKIEDIEALCRSHDLRYSKPNKSSHAKVSDPTMTEILTIPYKRPIKPIYVKKLVTFVDSVLLHRRHEELMKASGRRS